MTLLYTPYIESFRVFSGVINCLLPTYEDKQTEVTIGGSVEVLCIKLVPAVLVSYMSTGV